MTRDENRREPAAKTGEDMRQSARGVRRAQPRFNAESRAALAESDEILCAIRNGSRTPQTLDAFLAEMSAL